MNRHRFVRYAGLVCLAGATIQVIYGLLALLFPYPEITESRYELLWALANVGMVGGVVGWLALDVARPRWVAVVGGGLAILGHLIRIGVSVVLILRPSAPVDAPIVGTILLMFLGMGMLGIGTLIGKRLTGWQAWAPLLTVAAGLITATFYSIDKVVHFVLLGLFWGPAWMLVGYLVLDQTSKRGHLAHAASNRSPEHGAGARP
jgi:hypothetical protein